MHTLIQEYLFVSKMYTYKFKQRELIKSQKELQVIFKNDKVELREGSTISLKGEIFRRFIRTEVVFHKIGEKDITEEILKDGVGKAGGYAIQNLGSRFIKKIRGCYTNVVGISIPELYKILS